MSLQGGKSNKKILKIKLRLHRKCFHFLLVLSPSKCAASAAFLCDKGGASDHRPTRFLPGAQQCSQPHKAAPRPPKSSSSASRGNRAASAPSLLQGLFTHFTPLARKPPEARGEM